MKIVLRGMGDRDTMAALERSGAADPVGGVHGEMFFDASWPDPAVDEFLHRAAEVGPVDINPGMEFEEREVAASAFLRPRLRGRAIDETAADFARMRAHLDGLPWRGEEDRRYRLPDRLWLSKARLRPDEIAGAGEWTAEYVVGTAVREAFEAARLTGFELRPVLGAARASDDGVPVEDCFHLHCEHVLGDREMDAASPVIPGAGREALGCFCYRPETLEGALDFNRPSEGYVSFELPDWVVRARVRECVQSAGLRGWVFEPVLLTDSGPYREYEELWASLYDLLRACGRHTIRSQRFFAGEETS